MGTTDKSLARWLSSVSGRAVFWMMPLARILMCTLVFLSLPSAYQGSIHALLLQSLLYCWLGWTVATSVGALTGQPLQLSMCRLVVLGDGLLAIASIALLRGEEGATIAFAVCVIVFAMGLRIGRNLIFATFTMVPVGLLLRDALLLLMNIAPKQGFLRSGSSEIATAALQVTAIFSLILWGNRRYLLEKFSNDFSSLRMLSLERSFDFDLQIWVDALASLFAPDRAASLMAAPRQNSSNRYFHRNLPEWQNDKDRDELMAGLRDMPAGCSLLDCELNRVVSPVHAPSVPSTTLNCGSHASCTAQIFRRLLSSPCRLTGRKVASFA